MSLDVICEGKTCWTLREVEQSAVLVDGETYYSSFCAAALLAQRYIYITGWQFDTHARLLPRPSEAPLPHPVEMLAFLNYLCERTPELEIFLTAWDYSVVYALEREWLQKLKFDFQSHERVHFEFLDHPQAGASHHQKLAIVDGQVAFLGGLDLCDARWDTRQHRLHEPGRLNVNRDPYKAFHDIQVAVRGPVVGALRKLFAEGWARTQGKAALPEDRECNRPEAFDLAALTKGQGLPLRARRVAVCRTEPTDEGQPAKCEVQSLFEQAILGAQQLIYIETQYFTSRAIAEALCRRLTAEGQSKLELVLVMPNGADSPKEDFVLGNRQRAIRRLVAEVAQRHGHELRVLMSWEKDASGKSVATFIHSKLLLVDDEFVTIGSANLTNRSMRVDRELNVAFATQLETQADAELLRQDIRALRASLLAEHAGVQDTAPFEAAEGLIARLDQVCDDPKNKLHCQALPEAEGDDPLLVAIFDPSQPLDWSTIDDTLENAFENDVGFFRRGAQKVGQRLGVVDIE